MPARDGTGPLGTGPIGSGRGPCGAGRGFGHMGCGRGRFFRGIAPVVPAKPDADTLRQTAQALKTRLAEVEKEISGLEKEPGEAR